MNSLVINTPSRIIECGSSSGIKVYEDEDGNDVCLGSRQTHAFSARSKILSVSFRQMNVRIEGGEVEAKEWLALFPNTDWSPCEQRTKFMWDLLFKHITKDVIDHVIKHAAETGWTKGRNVLRSQLEQLLVPEYS